LLGARVRLVQGLYDGWVLAWRFGTALLTLGRLVVAQSYSPPAGDRPAIRRPETSILPGGRIVSALGPEYVTGAGPFGLALSPSGKSAATANGGPWRYGITILEKGKQRWDVRQLGARSMDALDQFGPTDWRSVSTGIVFSGEHNLYVAEGNSGRVSLFDSSDERRRVIDLNQSGYHDSYTGDLALDAERNILYVVDQANARVAVVDGKTRQILTSVKVGRLPFAMTLSVDRLKLYVTNVGLLEYRPIPGADPNDPRGSGLPFPAFGYPSAEASSGAQRSTARGPIKVPGVGDATAPEANSLCVIDVSTPASAKVEAFVPVGNSPSGVIAMAGKIFVSNAGSDSVTVIDAKDNKVLEQIPIRIPGLETLRGVIPIGLAWYEKSGWLLVAEAGMNAVGVIDVAAHKAIGHLPAAYYPTRVAIDGDTVFVTSAKGHGQGPNAPGGPRGMLLPSQRLQGTISVFSMPAAEDLTGHTAFVMKANGFQSRPAAASKLPDGVRHVVLIVKEGRSYDDVLGDIPSASNGPALGSAELAHLGSNGFVDGRHVRMSLRDVNITPNHHAIARQWAFSDNFYADGDGSMDGHHWLVGAYPNAWTQSSVAAALGELKDFRLTAPGRLAFAGTAASVQPEDAPEAGTLWQHLAAHGISFYNFGEGFELPGVSEGAGMPPLGARFLTNMPMPEALYRNTSREYPGYNIHVSDQARVTQFLHEVDEKYVKGGAELPQFLYLYLPGDFSGPARPDDGYPYEESFVADNDYAVGRVLEYLSGTKWWGSMAVFVTEADAQGGVDHIDSHRTILLCAGPWAKKNYVSHTNTSFPGLLKTIFGLLHIPALNLFDAAAADLSDCFSSKPDPAPYKAVAVDKRIFDPSISR
jgi:YVTN family beta-propeller protein